jgi:transcriptional regulator with GAF, ATPase, and Fis domain
VRIVAATHRDLAGMVNARAFREDLWYRINVFPILLPRLRERSGDIPALARHFAHKAAVRFGLPVVEPGLRELELLTAYHWPGNIRELGAVIDRAAILGNGQTLEVERSLGLSLPIRAPDAGERTAPPVTPAENRVRAPSEREMDPHSVRPLTAAMREHIERALSATRGRIEGRSGAAQLLGINPHTLRARMRKLQIEWQRFRE